MSRNILFATIAGVLLVGAGGGAYWVKTHKADLTSNPVVAGAVNDKIILEATKLRDDPNSKFKMNWTSVDNTPQGAVFHDFKFVQSPSNVTMLSKNVVLKLVGDKINANLTNISFTDDNPNRKSNIESIMIEDLPVDFVNSKNLPPEQKLMALGKTHVVVHKLSIEEPNKPSLKIETIDDKMSEGSIEALYIKNVVLDGIDPKVGDLSINSVSAHGIDLVKIILAQKDNKILSNSILVHDFAVDNVSGQFFKLDSVNFKMKDASNSTFSLFNMVPDSPQVADMKAKGFPIPDVVNINATGSHDATGFHSTVKLEAKNVADLDFSTFALQPSGESPAPRLQALSFKLTDKGGMSKVLALRGMNTPESIAVAGAQVSLMASQVLQMSKVADKASLPTLVADFITGKSSTLAFNLEVTDGKGFDPTGKTPPNPENLQIVQFSVK